MDDTGRPIPPANLGDEQKPHKLAQVVSYWAATSQAFNSTISNLHYFATSFLYSIYTCLVLKW
jgi:hypothetical protein